MTPTTFHIPRFESARLILRAPDMDDLPRMTHFYASERSHSVGGPRDAVDTWQTLANRIGHWALKGFGLWHLTEKSSDTFIGWAGVVEPLGWDEPELGWTLLAQAEGKGLAFEAATAARLYAARHFNLNGVISFITSSNDRSRQLAERLGAKYEREGTVVGTPCQVYRQPKLELA